MKSALFSLAALSALAAVPALAHAQAWTINERQASLDARIDAGVRQHTLTAAEAASLRGEFQNIARLETSYKASAPGLTDQEKADLNRRFDALSARIKVDRADNDALPTAGRTIAERETSLNQRIDMGVRQGTLTPAEAQNLRNEFRSIVQEETRFKASNGLNEAERDQLNKRFDALSARIKINRADNQRVG